MAIFAGSKRTYFVVLSANFTAFMSGVALSWSSPMIPALKDPISTPLERPIDREEQSWIGSLAAMGAIFGPFLFGYLFQRVGRKWANMASMVPFLLAYAIAAFADTVWLFYLARILMGAGVGGVFTILTVYAVEVSEPANRGILSASVLVFIVAGMLFTYSIGPFVSIMAFNLILTGICVVYFPVFWFVAPESPVFLALKNRDEEALSTIAYLRGKSDQEHRSELEEIKRHVDDLKPGSFADVFETRASVKALLYSVALTNFQQFCGINVITAFSEQIFDATGSNIRPEISSIIVGSVQFGSSFTSPLFSDRYGRRSLILTAIPGAFLAEVVIGVYYYLQDDGQDVSSLGWLPVLAMVVFIVFYNLGMGSLPWVIMSEILPSNVVSKAAAITTSVYWISGFFLTKYFDDLTDGIGAAGTFWLFSGFDVVFWVFTFVFMFETKGKSLKEIQDVLNK